MTILWLWNRTNCLYIAFNSGKWINDISDVYVNKMLPSLCTTSYTLIIIIKWNFIFLFFFLDNWYKTTFSHTEKLVSFVTKKDLFPLHKICVALSIFHVENGKWYISLYSESIYKIWVSETVCTYKIQWAKLRLEMQSVLQCKTWNVWEFWIQSN